MASKRAYYREFRAMYDSLTKMFYPRVEKALRQQVKFFTDYYKDASYITPGIIDEKPLEKAIAKMHVTAAINNAVRTEKYLESYKKADKETLNLWKRVVLQYLNDNGLNQLAIEITGTLKKEIQKVIDKGIREGWGVDKIVKELNDAKFPKWMAQRIVRTEINKASNTGAMVAAADSDLELNKEWISAQDNRTRRLFRDQYDHLTMDGKVVGFDERFIVPSTKTIDAMLYPGDPEASAGNLCNCRCTVAMIPKRDAEGQLIRRTQPSPNVFRRLLDQAVSIGTTGLLIYQLLENEAD